MKSLKVDRSSWRSKSWTVKVCPLSIVETCVGTQLNEGMVLLEFTSNSLSEIMFKSNCVYDDRKEDNKEREMITYGMITQATTKRKRRSIHFIISISK
jgi:hypothetical protein